MKIFADGLFEDKVAIITGGGTGIGLAIGRELGGLGAKLAICSRKAENVAAGRAELEELGYPVFGRTCDIRNFDEVATTVDAVLDKYGRIDILINNGGGQFRTGAENISPNGWTAVINTNLTGTWFMTQAVANKWMIPHGGGKICSIVAKMWRGFPDMMHTGAARAGVVNMTKTLSVEWARYGILINAVAPGTINSSGMKTYPPGHVLRSRQAIPLKRVGAEEEIAWAVAYLCSPAGDFITGATLPVDGGAALWGDLVDIPDPYENDQAAMDALLPYRNPLRKDSGGLVGD